MRVAYFLFLSLVALTNAGVAVKNDLELANNVQHDLSNQQFHLLLTAPDIEMSLEDHVVEYYNSLEVQRRSIIADTIKNVLEGFRDVVINGSGDIPILDPFVIDHVGPFVYTAIGVRAQGNIRNLRLEGLKWFLVDRVNFNALRLTIGVQITVPWIITTADYDARATVGFLTHNAGGNIRVFINRLVVSVDLRLGTNILGGGTLFLRELDIKIDIHDTHIQFTGMFGSSLINSFISSMVQSVTQEVIQSQLENVSTILSEELFEIVNDVLRDFTLDDLLG